MTLNLVNIVSNLPMLAPLGGREGLYDYIHNDCRCDGAEVISLSLIHISEPTRP